MTGARGACRPRDLLTPLTLLAVLCLSLLIVPASPAAAAEGDDPLTVTISSLAPSSIPRSGPVVIAGHVRNDSDEVWTDVRVYPLFSSQPMTTAADLTAAADSDPLTTDTGSRLTGEGQFVDISRLAPGSSASFRIRLPRRDLPVSGDPGVYWVGAQALGTNAEGRDLLADGRARTFIPLVPRRASARLALIAPLRQHIERDVRARIVDEAETAELFGADGRLGRLVATLGSEPNVSWLVDPGVLDAAADLGDNNPAMSLGPEAAEEPTPSPSPSPTTSSQGSPARSLDDQARSDATTWLSTLTGALSRSSSDTLALPYSDPDALALLRHRPQTLEVAQEVSRTRLEARGIEATSAVATPNRRLDDTLLSRAVGDLVAVTEGSGSTVTVEGSRRVVRGLPGAADGGPGPEPALSALNLRQRILAEAALRAIAGRTDTLVATLPDDWDPGARWQQAGFTSGLQTDWLDLAPLPSGATGGTASELRYTRADRRAEIDERLIGSAERLMESGTVLANLLETENDVALKLRSVALTGASYSSRADQSSAASLLDTMSDTVAGLTDKVRVVGTEFVTLSGGSGTITVSLINELPQPVRIGLDVRARDQDSLSFGENEPVTLAPQQRTTVRLAVRASTFGVNEVSISPITEDGQSVGTPLDVTIRSSEIGRWFWSVMIGAGCVLVVMIAKRIRDRIRTRRWRPVEDEDEA